MTPPPTELQQLTLNIFSCYPPKQRPSSFRLLLISSSVWALCVALSSLILPLRQPIQPFATSKALSGPPLHRERALFPRAPLPQSKG